jgi:hypothetical protein
MPDGVPITAGSGTAVDTDEALYTLTGTVAKAGTTALTGTGSAFLSELVVGDVVRVPGTANEDRVIATVTTDTAATVSVAFTNTASGQTGQRVTQRQKVGWPTSSTGTIARTALTGATQNIWAVNPNRNGGILYNDSTNVLYVKYGATASATSWTVQMGPGAYWEMPPPVWLGVLDVFSTGATGSLQSTELSV